MKRFTFLLLVPAMLAWNTATAQEDDLYYTPKKGKQESVRGTVKVKEPVKKEVTVVPEQVNVWAPNASTVVVRDRTGQTRDVDEYNRRYTNRESTFSIENDTLYIDEGEYSDVQGEWINGFEGSQDDYEYAMRIIRFRNPRYAIPVSSPLYWEVVYAQPYVSWDWNVYDDGMYAYIFPTFSNRLWWDWRYNWGWGWRSWTWSPYYSWGWGGGPYWSWSVTWHDPFFRPPYHGPYWSRGHNYWSRPAARPDYRPATAQRGHDRAARYNSGYAPGVRSSGGNNNRNSDSRYTGTRVSGSEPATSSRRFEGVQGYRSTQSNVRSSNPASVRPNATRSSNVQQEGNSSGNRSTRSTSSYVRPNSTRVGNNAYSRPSSTRSSATQATEKRSTPATTRSSSNTSTRRQESVRTRSYDSGRSTRSSSGYSGGSSRSSSGGGSSRSGGGGGHSRR